jgi:hypothetical protein
MVDNEEGITRCLETLSLDSRSLDFDADLRERIKEVVDNVVFVLIGANDEKATE